MQNRRKWAAWKIAGGALLVFATIVALAISGVTALSKWGFLTWVGWINLVAVFASSLALAWVLRARRTGLSLPQSPPTYLDSTEATIWTRLLEWVKTIRPDALAEDTERYRCLGELESILYPTNAVLGAPSWKDLTLTECAAAIRLTQSRLDGDARRMAGPILDIPLGDWKQGWQALKWYWRLAPLAWLPGILLAPWEAIARWTITRMGPEQINQSVTGRVRDDISRYMLMTLAESLIELRARRLRAGADVWLATHPKPTGKHRLVKGSFPWLSLFLAGVVAVVPWLTICLLGIWYLGANHPLPFILVLVSLVGGAALAGLNFRQFWPGSPKRAPVDCEAKLLAGQTAGENWLQSKMASATLPVADANAWLDSLVELDRTIRQASGQTETKGWDHLTPREILSWARDQAKGLDSVLRERIPGSMHISLGDWIKAADWAGINSNQPTPPPSIPSQSTSTLGNIWRNLKERVGGVVENIKKRVENLVGVTIARHACDGLASLHSHVYAGQLDEPGYAEAAALANDPSAPKTSIAVIGQTDSGLATLLEHLRLAPALQNHSIEWIEFILNPSKPHTIANKNHEKAPLPTWKQADLVVFIWQASTSLRSSDLDFLHEFANQFDQKPDDLPLPGIVIAFAKVEELPPEYEWAPPYNWENGTRPKEMAIRTATQQAEALLAEESRKTILPPIAKIIPVAVVDGTGWNLETGLAEALAQMAANSQARAWNQWITQTGRPGWSHLARQAKDAGKWLWGRL